MLCFIEGAKLSNDNHSDMHAVYRMVRTPYVKFNVLAAYKAVFLRQAVEVICVHVTA